jgi:hypothetical protein
MYERLVWQNRIRAKLGKQEKMLKKVTTDIKAAFVLIATEDLTALRMFAKNVTNSVFKSTAKHQGGEVAGQKKAITRKGT